MTVKGNTPSSTHPPLLPTPEVDIFHRLRLLRSRRVGISTYKRLLIEHGTAQNALAALPEVARAAGVQRYDICPEAVIRKEIATGYALGAQLISQDDPDFPQSLLPDLTEQRWCIVKGT